MRYSIIYKEINLTTEGFFFHFVRGGGKGGGGGGGCHKPHATFEGDFLKRLC